MDGNMHYLACRNSSLLKEWLLLVLLCRPVDDTGPHLSIRVLDVTVKLRRWFRDTKACFFFFPFPRLLSLPGDECPSDIL